jgi:protein phosphatase
VFQEGNVHIAYVGDSRVYCVRDKGIRQLTEDHSLVNEQVKAGLISEEDAKNHQLRNIITRSVGFQEEVEIDTLIEESKVGDRYLLCSDGLSNFLEETEIHEILSNRKLQDAAQDLVDLAIERGGDDNITLIVIEVIE